MRAPLLLVSNKVLFPGSFLKINVGKEDSVRLVESVFKSGKPGPRNNSVVISTICPEEEEKKEGEKLASEENGGETILTSISVTRSSGKKVKAYSVGVLGTVMNVLVPMALKSSKPPRYKYTLVIRGDQRVNIERVGENRDGVKLAQVTGFQSFDDPTRRDSSDRRALALSIKEQFQKLIKMVRVERNSQIARTKELVDAVNTRRLVELADLVTSALSASIKEKQKVLATSNVDERLNLMLRLLTRQVDVMQLSHELNAKVSGEVKEQQRKYYLQQHLKAIKKELGEKEGKSSPEDDIEELEKRLEAARLPPEAMRVAEREMGRLRRIPPQQPEHHVVREYIETLASLPWNSPIDRRGREEIASVVDEDNDDGVVEAVLPSSTAMVTTEIVDIDRAKAVLDADHFGLDKVKKRLMEYLAVCSLKGDLKSPIMCLVGPPGVGKTSLGASVARALNRPFHRISLGGVRDEAEIRGHRRTYIGALPGRIMQALRKVKANNPVILLDEVDKLGRSARGDPGAALLEVLDPAQNNSFVDSYVATPFDLSSVLFIATANSTQTIPAPLLDRMELIQIAGYTWAEKVCIASRHLLPRQLKAHGLSESHIKVSDHAWRSMAVKYTREAGVRQLDQKIASVCRSVALRVARSKKKEEVVGLTVSPEILETILGPPVYMDQSREIKVVGNVPGASLGLAWTSAGGEVLLIETALMRGSGKIILTGNVQNVMQESVRTALSWIQSHERNLKLKISSFRNSASLSSGESSSEHKKNENWNSLLHRLDLHVHFPAAATPKDGPSAGITIATALVSLMSGICPRGDTAMTGELSLLGLVLPVGGIKSKVLGAHRHGIRRLILPLKNKKDIEDVPEDVASELEIHFAEYFSDVLKFAFNESEFSLLMSGQGNEKKFLVPGPLDWLREIKQPVYADLAETLDRSFL